VPAPMDRDLMEILLRSNPVQGGSTLQIAQAMAQMQMQQEAQEEARAQRLYGNAQRRLQSNAMSDPALVRLRRSLEAPVEPYERQPPPGSYAPGAASDYSTLRGAFGADEPLPYNLGAASGGGGGEPPRRELEVAQGGRVAAGDRTGETVMNLPTLVLGGKGGGAFSEPELWDAEIGDPVRAPPRYETTVRGKREPKRKPLVHRKLQLEGGIDPHKFRDEEPPRRPDLSPEGAEMYAKLAPSLVSRRNSEETSRRTLEAEEMRQKGGERREQLRSATSLLRSAMSLQAQAERIKARRMGAKSKDEALKWADQERDARLQAMKAANALVQQYKYALTDESDPEYMEAVRAAADAARAYSEAERDFNALRSEKGMDPKGKTLKKGGTQSFTLDANGQLVPG